MIFNSIDFAIFFPLVFFIYWLVFSKKITSRNIFLLAVSYIFYGWWDWRFLSLIVISSSVDFIVGKKIHQEEDFTKRKLLLLVSLVVNLGFLVFFKYYNFFIDSFTDAFSMFGNKLDGFNLNIILPVGISFYTFQTLSYTLDIYYKKMKPNDDIVAFFAFVSFFPQLVAGPIERAKDLSPQFLKTATINYELLRSGLLLMVWGFFQKIVIADRLAIFVNGAYADSDNLDGITTVFAAIFFSFQLYLDFSAYSNIAIGSARVLGFNLSLNFKRPYLSNSFSDFWKRWHISLSSWFKDYVYIPLGGNKTSKTARNILIVFILSGFWHGATWNFIIWGALNGMFILLFDRFLSKADDGLLKKAISSVFVYTLWTLSLIFFRAKTFDKSIAIFSNLFESSKDILYNYGLNEAEFTFSLQLLGFYLVVELLIEKYSNIYHWFVSQNFVIRWTMYISLITVILLFGSYGVGLNDNSFIYFQF